MLGSWGFFFFFGIDYLRIFAWGEREREVRWGGFLSPEC